MSDTVEGLRRMMDGTVEGPVDIGNPDEHTVLELAEIVLHMTSSAPCIVYRPLPTDDPQRRKPGISLAASALGWRPRVGLEEGPSRTIDYFRDLLQIGRRATVNFALRLDAWRRDASTTLAERLPVVERR